MSNSKVIKCSNFEWDRVDRRDYKDDRSCYKGVHRYSILGEGEDEQMLNFQTRYFEVGPGGYTTLEYHRHPHSVIIIRGSGSMILDDETHELGVHDVVFIAPDSLHQFHADKDETLGFICVVDRYRDKPMLPDEEYLAKEVKNPVVKEKLRR